MYDNACFRLTLTYSSGIFVCDFTYSQTSTVLLLLSLVKTGFILVLKGLSNVVFLGPWINYLLTLFLSPDHQARAILRISYTSFEFLSRTNIEPTSII